MICEQCGKDIPENEIIEISGTAEVTGETTLEEFFKHGVAWVAGSSSDEKILCPHCNNYTRLNEPEVSYLVIM